MARFAGAGYEYHHREGGGLYRHYDAGWPPPGAWILSRSAATGSRELFTLAVLALALGIAFGAVELFDVSFALGAFFAGMVLNESELSHRAAHDTLPLRDAFAVLFFVSVGMLFNPMILIEQPLAVLGTWRSLSLVSR